MESPVIMAGDIGFLTGAQATFKITGANRMVDHKKDGVTTTEVKPMADFFTIRPWAEWGDNDLWPEDMRTQVKTSIMLSTGIKTKAKMLMGSGLMTYKLQQGDDGKETLLPITDPVVDQWIKDSNFNYYLSQATYHHEFYNNLFPQLIFSADKKKVNKIIWQKPRYCRWQRIDKNAGEVLNCYISAWFDTFPTPNDKLRVRTMPVMNLWDDMDAIRADDNTFEYIFRAMYPLSDNDYYAVPAWNAAVESGWTEVERRIPELKKQMFKNGMNIKWHIEMPYNYWENKWGKAEWDKFDEKQKKLAIENTLKDMNDFLSGSENAYKAFVSHFGIDPVTKQALPGWKITRLDGETKGEFLDELDQANTQTSYALGLNRALFGSSHNGQGAGSGSDIRESYLIATSMLRLDRDFVLMPLYWAKMYNGWDADLLFGFRDVVMTTLDKNPTGSQKVASN